VEYVATARAYLAGEGAFPQRAALNQLAGRFLTEHYAMVDRWAAWATEVVEAWPDDPLQAVPDCAVYEEAIRIAERNLPPGVTRSAG
jgi:PadR family transcriptional regulator AphA